MFGIEQKVANTAKRAGLLSGGLLLCSVGVGFLTVAGWLALVPVVGMQTTALIVAGTYLGIGLLMIGVGSGDSKKLSHDANAHHASAQPSASTPNGPPIVQAFLYGLQAGSQANQTRH